MFAKTANVELNHDHEHARHRESSSFRRPISSYCELQLLFSEPEVVDSISKPFPNPVVLRLLIAE